MIKAVVIATIAREGKVLDETLHMKSGSDEWDAAAMEAIGKAAPFGPLPSAYKGGSVGVHFHFEYAK